jgi:hypothetical protein
MRTVAAREMLSFRDELVAALGGDAKLSPQQRKLIDLAARTSLYLDHLDAWLTEQKTLINRRSRSVLPVLLQRQTLAEHLARLLDKLGLDRVSPKVGPPSAVALIPDNGRDQLAPRIPESELAREIARVGRTPGGKVLIYIPDKGRDQPPSGDMANGQHPAHRSPESESPTEIASVELPPRDDVISPNGDHHYGDDVERDLGLR